MSNELRLSSQQKKPRVSGGGLAAPINARVHLQSVRVLALNAALVATMPVAGDCTTATEVSLAMQRREDGFAFAFKLMARTVAAAHDDHPVFDFDAAVELHYVLSDVATCSDEALTAFGTTTGALAAWPYLRELLSSTSQRFGLVPIVLDVFRLSLDDDAPANAD